MPDLPGGEAGSRLQADLPENPPFTGDCTLQKNRAPFRCRASPGH
jgi:hypothetical protein